ncbi:MAG: hypothetical protein HOW73_20675 [Polyangiaceae bacterium]|nr:hypothetical protein [Polyangiaceae bacterium]
MTPPVPKWVPLGSQTIEYFARARGFAYEARPEERWFRHWEPHDTMVAPELWVNSCTERTPYGVFVVAEPWTANEGVDPVERAVVAFAQIGGPVCRAAMRVGEPFLTRVAFLESPPPPKVLLGDAVWDEHVTTFAHSIDEAKGAFPPKLRKLLQERGFKGHLEIRRGGFVVHHEGVPPTAYGYELTFRVAHDIAKAFIFPN